MTGKTLIPTLLRLWPREAAPPGALAGDPFLRLDSGETPFLVYLASMELDGRIVVPFVALALEPNEYSAPLAAAHGLAGGNDAVERIWEEAMRAHAALKTGATIAALERQGLPRGSRPDEAGSAPERQPPLTYCRKMAVYITPVCPTCLGALSACRDEGLLRRCGLPSYRNTLHRFLHCRACADDASRPPTFYAFSPRPVDSLAPGVRLRHRSEVYRDLAPKLATETLEPPEGHACFRCPHRPSCYPVGRSVEARVPAEDLLYPVAYYDFFALPLEYLPLTFEETAALLGGAPFGERVLSGQDPETTGGGNGGATVDILASIRRGLTQAGDQFFFEGDQSGLFPLEALYLKLIAFAGLLRGALDLSREAGRPHLALSPERIRGAWVGSASPMPARWGLALKIADLLSTGASVEPERAIPDEPPVWSFPLGLPEAFLPEEMSRPQRESLRMRLRVRALQPETRIFRLEAELVSDHYRESEHGRHDRVRFMLATSPGDAGGLVFSGRKAGRVPGGFVFEGTSLPLSEEDAARFDPKRIPATLTADVTIDHVFAAPADLVSLGLILLRILLENDRQNGSSLGLEAITRAARTEPAPERVVSALGTAGITAGPEQVLFQEKDRKTAHPAFPPYLWEDALLFALRLATNIPGFSLCGSQDAYPPENPAAPLEAASEEAEALIERARGALLGSSGRNGVVQDVLSDFLEDLQSAPLAGAATQEVQEEDIGRTIVISPKKKRP